MRVLLQGRPDLFTIIGGDSVQLPATVAGLTAAGVDASLSLDLHPHLNGFDLVHVFNLMRADEAVVQADNCRYQGRPVVVTPIYWSRADGENDRALLRRWPGEQRLRQKVLATAAAILVGARGEGAELERDFTLGVPWRAVHLGVQPPLHRDPEPFVRAHGVRDSVLCVARIAPHKNQLGLIRALAGLPFPLVFIGQVHDPAYYRECVRHADRNALFLGPVEEKMLWSAYAAARVHAMPSWRELPGLTSLEAAVSGCRVVSTCLGTAREYLGEDAWYCDPADPESIRAAVVAADQAPRNGRPAEWGHRFTWERAGREIKAVYEEVLADHHSR